MCVHTVVSDKQTNQMRSVETKRTDCGVEVLGSEEDSSWKANAMLGRQRGGGGRRKSKKKCKP